MEAFTRGDIVIFPFPYTDLTNRKIRPCLILSEEMNQDIILCQITSKQIKKDKYSIELSKDEAINGTLQIDSLIRTNMIFTADKKQLIKKICQINNKKYNEVIDKIIETISKTINL